jgi:hypothetical protein
MHERAIIFGRKFILNGIIGFLLSAFLNYYAIIRNDPLIPISLLCLVIACGCLYFGIYIYKDLNAKDIVWDLPAMKQRKLSFKHFDIILRIVLVAVTLIAINHLINSDYIASIFVIVNGSWLFSQKQLLNSYLKV